MSAIKGTLSMCRRAGMLAGGMDEAKSSVRRKASRLVLVASDVSDNSRAEIARECKKYGVELLGVPDTVFDIADAVGKRYGIISIEDKGFAESLRKKLSDVRLEDNAYDKKI